MSSLDNFLNYTKELLSQPDKEHRMSTITAFGIKFMLAAVIVLLLFIYLDRTSSLNEHTPEENKKLYSYAWEKEQQEKKEKEAKETGESDKVIKDEGKATGTAGGKKLKSRKV